MQKGFQESAMESEVESTVPTENQEQNHRDISAEIKQFMVASYQKVESFSDQVPEWIPCISPLIKYVKTEFASGVIAQGIDPTTGQEFSSSSDKWNAFLKTKLESFLHHAEAGVDIALIVATAGAGAPEDIAGKALLKRVVQEWLKQTSTNVGKEAVTSLLGNIDMGKLHQTASRIGDSTNTEAPKEFVELFSTSVRKIGDQLGKESSPIQEAGTFFADTMDRLIQHPIVGKTIVQAFGDSPAWKTIQTKASVLAGATQPGQAQA